MVSVISIAVFCVLITKSIITIIKIELKTLTGKIIITVFILYT